jgi:hypothetical protein
MEEKKVKGLEEGPPIYIESLLSPLEYMENSRRYKTYRSNRPLHNLSDYDPSLFRWRWRMGLSLLPEEIANINYNLAYLREQAGIKPQ